MTWEVCSNTDSKEGSFITRFSYDVLSIIFSQLTFKECIRATRVCRTWYECILRLPDVWREISDEEYDIPQDLMSLSDYFAGSEVRTLRLMTKRRSPRVQAVQFIVDHDCRNIEEAHLAYSFLKIDTLLQLLKLFGNNLTVLTLNNFLHLNPSAVLHAALEHCPNLQTFSHFEGPVRTTSNSQLKWSLPENFKLSNLQTFSIDLHGNPPIDALLSGFPKLRWIRLNASNYLNCNAVLQSLHQFQQCQIIRFWNTGAMTYDRRRPEAVPITIAPSATYSPDVQNGLQELDLRYNEGVGDISLIPVLRDHHQTLTHLDLHACASLTRETVACLGSLGWPNLQTFSLGATDAVFEPQHLVSFIGQAPRLSTVGFCHIRAVTDQVLIALGELDHLENVYLQNLPDTTSAGFIEFFSNETKRIQLRIANISHHAFETINDVVMECIAYNCPFLEELDITNCRGVNTEGYQTFVNAFVERSSLRKICFSSTMTINGGIKNGTGYAQDKLGPRVEMKDTPQFTIRGRGRW